MLEFSKMLSSLYCRTLDRYSLLQKLMSYSQRCGHGFGHGKGIFPIVPSVDIWHIILMMCIPHNVYYLKNIVYMPKLKFRVTITTEEYDRFI